MFAAIWRRLARTWPFWLIFWPAVLVLLGRIAPPWSQTGELDTAGSLSADAPSVQAERLLAKALPNTRVESLIVLVLYRGEGLTPRDKLFVTFHLVPALRRMGTPESVKGGAARRDWPIERIRSIADQYVGQLLLSPDKQATIVQVELATDLFSVETRQIVEQTDGILDRMRADRHWPEGLQIEVTGSAVIGRDLMRARQLSGVMMLRWTSWIALVAMLLVFRRPLLVLVPLVAVGVAIATTLRILSLLGQHGAIGLYEGMEVYFILPVYAAGIFTSGWSAANYRRRLSQGGTESGAIAGALAGTGKAIVAGALASIAGGAALLLTRFARYQLAGNGVVLGLAILVCVELTLVPALLCLMGRWAFWPEGVGRSEKRMSSWPTRRGQAMALRRIWSKLADLVERRPGAICVAMLVVMLPLAAAGIRHYGGLSFSLVQELRPQASSRQGIRLLAEHFPPGITAPVTLVMTAKGVDFGSSEGIGLVRAFSERLLRQGGDVPLADIRSVASPIGTTEVARHAIPGPKEVVALVEQVIQAEAVLYYVGKTDGTTRDVTRMDLIFNRDPMSPKMIDSLDDVKRAIQRELPEKLRDAQIHLLGITPELHDLADAVERDRPRIELWATLAVLTVLMVAVGQIAMPLAIVVGIVLSYLAAMGTTYLVFQSLTAGTFHGISWQVPILVFLTLIVSGCHDSLAWLSRADQLEQRRRTRRGAGRALRSTGGLIVGSALILACTFGSQAIGATLTGVPQFALAMALGVLLDGILVRILLVPSLAVLLRSRRAR